MADARPIGVMDSGMGGLSVLRSLIDRMPNERFIFWGDNKNAPYGSRSEDDIRTLTWNVVDKLLARDIKALVIACNTATAAAVADLRGRLQLPVVGLEPALKPASEYAGDGKVVVLATEATIRLEKYRHLLERYGHNTVSVPCPEFVEFVERGETDTDAVLECVRGKLAPYGGDIRAVVLGCTHFVWLRETVQKAAPEAKVFDGNDAMARHLRGILEAKGLRNESGDGGFELNTTSDDPEMLNRMHMYLAMPL